MLLNGYKDPPPSRSELDFFSTTGIPDFYLRGSRSITFQYPCRLHNAGLLLLLCLPRLSLGFPSVLLGCGLGVFLSSCCSSFVPCVRGAFMRYLFNESAHGILFLLCSRENRGILFERGFVSIAEGPIGGFDFEERNLTTSPVLSWYRGASLAVHHPVHLVDVLCFWVILLQNAYRADDVRLSEWGLEYGWAWIMSWRRGNCSLSVVSITRCPGDGSWLF